MSTIPFKSEQIAQAIFLLGEDIENFTAEELVPVLKDADHLYHNGGAVPSFLTDEEYDTLRKYTEKLAPSHSYFTGIGAEVRGGKVKLPYQMGSLDQVEIGGIADWVGNWSLQEEHVIITDKLDGTSAMVLYDENGDLQIAYSRGNGIEGADVTRHIKHFVPQHIDSQNMTIRGEVILTKPNFEHLKTLVKRRGGGTYKNARNMVAGLMNSSTNDPVVYQYLHFVAYDVIGTSIRKTAMLDVLRELGFRTPYDATRLGSSLTDDVLADYLNERRNQSPYEIDGIVIDVDGSKRRREMNPTRDTLNPAYSIKYKVADASNGAWVTVEEVEWNVSKHGYLKPRVRIEPTDLVGVTIRHATGFNAKFIFDNQIGPGARVHITRSGDVIPYLTNVVKPAPAPDMPTVEWEWNDTRVDAVVINPEDHIEININRAVDFFATLDIPHLKAGNVKKLFDADYQSVQEIIMAAKPDLYNSLGENGNKIFDGLREKLIAVPLYKLMGATHFFGRGVGVRKFKKLFKALGINACEGDCIAGLMDLHEEMIVDVEGFDQITAEKIVSGMSDFRDFLHACEWVTYSAGDIANTGGTMTDHKVAFTGFRDKELHAEVEAQGGTMQSAVSGKTTILVAKNPTSSSGKMKKARDNGTQIMGIEEFKEFLS